MVLKLGRMFNQRTQPVAFRLIFLGRQSAIVAHQKARHGAVLRFDDIAQLVTPAVDRTLPVAKKRPRMLQDVYLLQCRLLRPHLRWN